MLSIWNDKKTLLSIFRKTRISKYHVEGLILQLIATGILEMYIDYSQLQVSDANIRVTVDRDMTLTYCNTHAFRGMHVYPIFIQTPSPQQNKRSHTVTPSPELPIGGETGAQRVAKLLGFNPILK